MKSGTTLLAVAFLTVYPLAFLLQGIDFTDMGFNLSNQWLLLEDAGSYSHGHLFYLANLLGGLWLALTKPLGLLGAKLGWALVLYITMYAAYRTLKGSGGQAGLLVGLIVAVLWNTRIGTSWISYNTLTAMFFTIAAYALVTGLTRDRTRLVFIAGAVLGCTPFIRLPNVLIVALVIAIPAYAHLAKHPRAWTLMNTARFGLGFSAGMLGVVLLMYSLGHLPLFWESLKARLAASAGDAGYAYSGGQLLGQLFNDYTNLLLTTTLALAALTSGAWGLTANRVWRFVTLIVLMTLGYMVFWSDFLALRWFLSAILILTAFFALASWSMRNSPLPGIEMGGVMIGIALLIALSYSYLQSNWAWVVPGLLYVVMAFRYVRLANPDERLLVIVAALLMAITPLGSSNGIINAIFGMWIAIPLAFMTLFDQVRAESFHRWYLRRPFVYCAVASASLLSVALNHAIGATYRDSSNRSRMYARIDQPYLQDALTTPERAIVVTELMSELPKYVSPGDSLLIHGGCALVHLLTQTRPVLGSTWNGVYSTRMFHEKLTSYDKANSRPPPVLLSKGSCRAREWPSVLVATPTEAETRHELISYMKKHDYRLRWQNAFFEIWTP